MVGNVNTFWKTLKNYKGEGSEQKMSQIVEKAQKGGGVSAKIKKVYISNVDSHCLRGGGLNFSDFSQIQITEIFDF